MPATNAEIRRIAAVFMSLPVGGAEDLALALARALRPRGLETHFLCLREEGPLAREIRQAGFPCTLLPIAPRKSYAWLGPMRLASWLRENQMDLVHSHTYHAHTYAIPAAQRIQCPAFLHHHKTLEKMKWHRRWTLARLTSQAQKVLALSEQTAGDLQKTFRLPKDTVQALPNAVDASVFTRPTPPEQQQRRQELGLPSSAPLLLTVASLQEVKNHQLILQALARLAPQSPEWQAVFVGEGPRAEDLRQLAADLGLTGRVHLVGTQRPVVPWFQAADAFAFPSLWEGQSLALLQALSCELPVVASRIEGNTALLGPDYPTLFYPDRPEELVAFLSHSPEELRRLTATAVLPPRPQWCDLVDQMEKLYRWALRAS